MNCAGDVCAHALLDVKEADWDRIFAVNTKGTLFCMQTAARAMIDSGNGGRIINISSAAGKTGRPLLAAYSASKAAVINLTQSAAYALADHKINVNAICPGMVQTASAMKAMTAISAVTGEDVSETIAKVPAAPLDGLVAPEDVARMVVFLAGPGGSHITGQSINVDGGRCMH